jgi:hypothetical protein
MLFARSYFLGGEDPSLLPKLACIVPWYLDANVAVRSRVPAADDFADSDVEESCFLSFVGVCREDEEDKEEEEEFSLSGELPGGLSFSAFFIFVFDFRFTRGSRDFLRRLVRGHHHRHHFVVVVVVLLRLCVGRGTVAVRVVPNRVQSHVVPSGVMSASIQGGEAIC